MAGRPRVGWIRHEEQHGSAEVQVPGMPVGSGGKPLQRFADKKPPLSPPAFAYPSDIGSLANTFPVCPCRPSSP